MADSEESRGGGCGAGVRVVMVKRGQQWAERLMKSEPSSPTLAQVLCLPVPGVSQESLHFS